MCGRCSVKWQKVVLGAALSQCAFSSSGDLLLNHVGVWLERHPNSSRRVVCETALLEVHQIWIAHNGEARECKPQVQ